MQRVISGLIASIAAFVAGAQPVLPVSVSERLGHE